MYNSTTKPYHARNLSHTDREYLRNLFVSGEQVSLEVTKYYRPDGSVSWDAQVNNQVALTDMCPTRSEAKQAGDWVLSNIIASLDLTKPLATNITLQYYRMDLYELDRECDYNDTREPYRPTLEE